MKVLCIKNNKQGKKPELRPADLVREIDIPMIEKDGLDGEIRIFEQNGALHIYFPKKLELLLNSGGDVMVNMNTLEIRLPS